MFGEKGVCFRSPRQAKYLIKYKVISGPWDVNNVYIMEPVRTYVVIISVCKSYLP